MKIQIERIDESLFCTMVKNAFNAKKTNLKMLNGLFIKRDTVMREIYSSKMISTDTGLISIDCNSNIDYTIEHVLPRELFSYIRKKTCTLCEETIVSNRVFIDINLQLLAKKSVSISDLNDIKKCVMVDSKWRQHYRMLS